MHSFDDQTIRFHSFHWDNYSLDMLTAHKRVMQHLGLKVEYTCKNIPHGQWLDEVFAQNSAQVVAIIEPDLFPLNREIVQRCLDYVLKEDTFVGIAQASNHIHPMAHIYAAPAFFLMTKSCYERLGRPSFTKYWRGDVGQRISYLAERKGVAYRTLYPTCFEREPQGGAWRLGSYGYYGIGTVFGDAVYHLYQGRVAENVQLFIQRADELISGRFNYAGFRSATAIPYTGKFVVNEQKWYKKIIRW